MDSKPYEKMIELLSRAEEKGVILVLTFTPDSDIDEQSEAPFRAIGTNSKNGELVFALVQRLEDEEEDV